MGPARQLKYMFNETRWIASLIFIGSIVLTLVAAFAVRWLTTRGWGAGGRLMRPRRVLHTPAQLHSKILCLIAVLVQIAALGWYALSYIPYGRAMCSQCFSSAMNIDDLI